jgi:Kef-type K+ transport system membrane component KefB
LGPSLFGIVSSNESLEMLSNIAIFFVLLFIGLEMDIRQVKRTASQQLYYQ